MVHCYVQGFMCYVQLVQDHLQGFVCYNWCMVSIGDRGMISSSATRAKTEVDIYTVEFVMNLKQFVVLLGV